ncbi:hypothetical protein EJV46_07225 [Roseococcus sp. SYP-B2431]|uniref:hypothetical protein n=1 Tax=Roseococcus sp. SYP-B2431 TaxID=2496640 RepID=UPI00103A0714|nr:hypothetical protein [Roseococcus sp. SYP-B2431]TCI00416.1 hypothetical protein EJV46_07225 [Roseococcus sp. SYP-B2431]
MFESKTGLILLYLGLVGTVCLWPFLLQLRRHRSGSVFPALLGMALAAGAAALLVARGVAGPLAPVGLAPVMVLPLLAAGLPAVLAGLSALVVLSGTVWWAPATELGVGQAAVFVLAGLGAAALPRLGGGREGLPKWPALAFLAGVGLAGALATGVFSAPGPFMALWHHWSAYVAPAEALLAGGMPFRDFPVQYGMGPTLLIALACGTDCWPGTYALIAATNVAYLLAMGACVVLQMRQAPRGVALLALLALVASVMFWTGYPPDFIGWLVTPSVGGMRFLPLALLLLHILRREVAGEGNDMPRPDWAGHALWLFGLAWSPEAGFFVSLVWWPYLALRQAQARTGSWPVLAALLAGAMRAVVATAAGVAVLVIVFRLAFGGWPSLFGFLAYVRNPPGVLHPNPLGPVWLIPAAVAAALAAMSRTDERGLRTGFASLAALLAAASYYLGRSHDNNVLNLLPFLVLALVPAAASAASGVLQGFSRSVMAGLVAWIATFGHGSWNEAWRSGRWADLGPSHLLRQIRLEDPDAQVLFDRAMAAAGTPAPAADAVAALRAIGGEAAPVWVHGYRLLPGLPAGRGWTGVNNIGNYGELPSAVIEHFVRQGRDSYARPGWILVDRSYPAPWMEHYRGAYDIAEERVFGGYTAYRLIPR